MLQFSMERNILSPQQVAGFFSRLAARTRKMPATLKKERESEDEEQSAVKAEALHSHLKAVVNEEIAFTPLSPFPVTFAVWFIQRNYLH